MHKNFSEWYRIANIDPTDTILKSRWEGIKEYCNGEISSNDLLELIRLFFKLPVQDKFREAYVECFCKVDSAFPKKNDMELSVLAGATLVYIVENYNGLDDIVMLALITASFNKREAAVPDVLIEVKNIFSEESSEIRNVMKDVTGIQGSIPSQKKLLESLKNTEATTAWDPTGIVNLSNYLVSLNKLLTTIKEATNQSAQQQKVYIEDSQILWWMTGEWSKDLQKPVKQLQISEACIVAGKELADFVELLPGPYASKSVLYKVLSIFPEEDIKSITHSTAINKLDKDWKQQVISKYSAETTKEITPLLSSISESLKVEKDFEWKPIYKKLTGFDANKTKISALELAYQMYLECLVIKSIQSSEG